MFTTPVFQRRAIAAACTLLIANLACAQSAADSAAEAPMETVTVTGNWLGSGQQSLKTFAGARTVVKRDDIQQSGADSIGDVLRAVPGLQITDNSSSGGSAISLNVGVRGLEGRYSPRSTVLLDGVPLAVAPYGQPQLSFAPVSLANIDSVDVVRGGGAVRYGPQNVGGVINFKTRAIPNADLVMEASARYNRFENGNSNGQYSVFAGSRDEGGLGVAMLYSGMTGDGARAHSNEKLHDFALKFNYPLSASSELNAKLSYYNVTSETPGGLSVAQYNADPYASLRNRDYWDGERKGVSLSYINTLSATREVEVLSYFNQSSRQSLLASGIDSAATLRANSPRNYNVGGIEPRFTQRLTFGNVRNDITVGYRYLQERADERNINILVSTGSATTTRNSENSTDAHSLYVDDQIAFGKWRVTPGVRYENIKTGRTNVLTRFEQEVSNTKALPSVNVAYLLNRDTTLFANYNTSFGSIQHLQLNLQSSTDALQPETAKTYELGARYGADRWQLEATAFNLDFSNQIVYVNTAPLYYKNLGKTQHSGLETRAEYAFAKGGMLSGLSAYATYAYTKATQEQGTNAGKDVPFYSRNVDTQGARYKWGGLVFDLNTTHQSKQYADEANTVAESADGSLGVIPGYRLFNTSVSYVFPGAQRIELQAGANNLADKRTFTRTTDTNLGKLAGASRMVYLQVRTQF